MKKIMFILVLAILSTAGAQAQLIKKKAKKESVENEAYKEGEVPVINGKVTFETEIPAPGLSATQVEEKVNAWIADRYVKPTVISVQRFESGKPGTTIIKGEEYIVFRSSFFILDRARMYYFLTLTAKAFFPVLRLSSLPWHLRRRHVYLQTVKIYLRKKRPYHPRRRLREYGFAFCKTG